MKDVAAWKEIWRKVRAYRKLKAQKDDLEKQMDDLKPEIAALVEANGKWTDEDGYARIVKRKPSVAFDAKALEALYQSVAYAKTILEPHRKVNAGYTYLQIK
jgi:heme oxygenase